MSKAKHVLLHCALFRYLKTDIREANMGWFTAFREISKMANHVERNAKNKESFGEFHELFEYYEAGPDILLPLKHSSCIRIEETLLK